MDFFATFPLKNIVGFWLGKVAGLTVVRHKDVSFTVLVLPLVKRRLPCRGWSVKWRQTVGL